MQCARFNNKFVKLFFNACLLLMTILFVGCATQQYYATTVNSWQGSNTQKLFKRWGLPDRQMQLPNGHTVYVYTLQESVNTSSASTHNTDAYQTGGQSYVAVTHTSYAGGEHTIKQCTTWFEADSTGKIVGVSYSGDACRANSHFNALYGAG